MRILSGIQPSGALHLGNYFGMMKPAIELQDKGEAFYFIANYHSMTSVFDAAQRRKSTLDVALDFLACGRDQKQHVEMTRDIAMKFNETYGQTFVIPEPQIREEVAVVPGVDGQKMSKSYANTID